MIFGKVARPIEVYSFVKERIQESSNGERLERFSWQSILTDASSTFLAPFLGISRPLRRRNVVHTCIVACSTKDEPDEMKKLKAKKLFQQFKPPLLYNKDKIDVYRAMAEFNLKKEDLM